MTETKESQESKEDLDDLSTLGVLTPMTRDASKPVKITRDRKTPIDVYPWFEITVQDIDIATQKWHASVEIHLFWQDFGIPAQCPSFEQGIFFGDLENDSPIKLSEIFENKVWENPQPVVLRYLPETSTMYMLVVVEVEFSERMELERFPMDRQFLNMDFNAWVSPDPDGKRCNWNWIVNPPDWVQNDDFRLPFAVRMLSSITEYKMLGPWIDFSGKKQPLSIRLRVERQPGFYFASMILPNFLIVLASFAAFPILIDDDDKQFIADRLSISVTLMLTAVAFRYVISDQLPKVTYLTVMDYYLLEGFMMLTLLIFENAFVGITSWPAIASREVREQIDTVVAAIFILLWGLTHVWWLIVLWKKNFMRIPWDTMDEMDKDDNDEFKKPPDDKWVGNSQSQSVVDEWTKLKGKSAEQRALDYARKHPELLPKTP